MELDKEWTTIEVELSQQELFEKQKAGGVEKVAGFMAELRNGVLLIYNGPGSNEELQGFLGRYNEHDIKVNRRHVPKRPGPFSH